MRRQKVLTKVVAQNKSKEISSEKVRRPRSSVRSEDLLSDIIFSESLTNIFSESLTNAKLYALSSAEEEWPIKPFVGRRKDPTPTKPMKRPAGTEMDESTKTYVDARHEVLEAKIDARIAEMSSKIDDVRRDVGNIPTTWQLFGLLASAVVTSVIAVVSILAFASDRFDGGLSASSVVRQAVQDVQEAQVARDARQDQKLEQILEIISRRVAPDDNGSRLPPNDGQSTDPSGR